MTYDSTDSNADGVIEADVENDSVSTKNLQNESDLLLVGGSGSLVRRLDPQGRSTPVQDAFDILGPNGGGTVYLPGTKVTNDGPITNPGSVGLIGHGLSNSIIEITATGSNVHGLELNGPFTYGSWFTLQGPGETEDTGVGLYAEGEENGQRFHNYGPFQINSFGNRAIHFKRDTAAGPWQSTFQQIEINNCDAGGEHLILIEGDGTAKYVINNLRMTASDAKTGQDSGALFTEGDMQIGFINAQGAISSVTPPNANPDSVIGLRDASMVINTAFYEPLGDNNSTPTHIIGQQGGSLAINRVRVFESTSHVYGLLGPQYSTLPAVFQTSNVNNEQLRALSGGVPNNAVVEWQGRASDVLNNPGYTETVWAKADGKWADPVESKTGVQISGGGTSTVSLDSLNALGEEIAPRDIDVTVVGRGTATDVGYSVDKVWYDESLGNWAADLSETEGGTSITVDVEVQR
jgi:hypothetical protein